MTAVSATNRSLRITSTLKKQSLINTLTTNLEPSAVVDNEASRPELIISGLAHGWTTILAQGAYNTGAYPLTRMILNEFRRLQWLNLMLCDWIYVILPQAKFNSIRLLFINHGL